MKLNKLICNLKKLLNRLKNTKLNEKKLFFNPDPPFLMR